MILPRLADSASVVICAHVRFAYFPTGGGDSGLEVGVIGIHIRVEFLRDIAIRRRHRVLGRVRWNAQLPAEGQFIGSAGPHVLVHTFARKVARARATMHGIPTEGLPCRTHPLHVPVQPQELLTCSVPCGPPIQGIFLLLSVDR